jgi:hypothetical protein
MALETTQLLNQAAGRWLARLMSEWGAARPVVGGFIALRAM